MTVLNSFRHDARVQREAKSLASAGHEVLVLAVEEAGLPKRECMDGFAVHRVPMATRHWPHLFIFRIVKYLEYSVRTLRSALAWNAQVYHAHDANTLPVAYTAARLRGARLVYDAHELETERNWGNTNLSSTIRRLWSLPERLFIGGTDAVITVCKSIADELERSYGIAPPKVVRNIPNSQGSHRPVRLRQEVGLGDDVRIVLYQGGVRANRGIEEMLEALALLNNAAFVVLGKGPQLPPLREKARQMGLNDRVFFLGHIPLADLPGYTASADVGVALIQDVCRSYYYSLPNKLFEYVQAGLPVVVSDFPEMAPIVRDYEVGEVVDPSHPVEIGAAIRRILEDDSYHQRLHQNALRAARHLNWKQESRQLLEVYHELERYHP